MDKLEMAHEWYMKNVYQTTHDKAVVKAWEYADAMQSEMDKRTVKGVPEAIRETHRNMKNKIDLGEPLELPTGRKRCAVIPFGDDWQPDWSQAPEWANWWAQDENLEARWILSELGDPYIGMCGSRWYSVGRFNSEPAPTFNYTGKWQDSLRKRP